MNSLLQIHPKVRRVFSKTGSLVLLFQRSPVVQMILPEARVMGTTGAAELVKWTVASVAGLGVYDTVAGATVMAQIAPTPVVTPIRANAGSSMSFTVQVTGAPGNPKSWQIVGALPNGISKTSSGSTCTLSGVPSNSGSFPITIKAWENSGNSGGSISKAFSISVAAVIPVITTNPASGTINSGSTVTLSVIATGTTPTFQWYIGNAPSTASPISGATSASYNTPALTATTSYWARATNTAGSDNSTTATINVRIPPAFTTQPSPVTINSGGTATLTVAATGTAPTFQWYVGNSSETGNPVADATSASFTTPALTADTRYWARATNAAGFADSSAALVSVTPLVNTFPDWLASQFDSAQLADPAISGPSADPDGDGISNDSEYVLGLPALTAGPSPVPAIASGGGQISLAFTAKAASGLGYAGRTRHYALETTNNPIPGSWAPAAGFEDIIGNDQSVNFNNPLAAGKQFYHLKVWLTP